MDGSKVTATPGISRDSERHGIRSRSVDRETALALTAAVGRQRASRSEERRIMKVRRICQVVAGIEVAALALALVELLRILRVFQKAGVGPYDPLSQERIIFWYQWRVGAAALTDLGFLLRAVPVGAWMVFILLLVSVGSFFRLLWRKQAPDLRSRWLTAACLLPVALALAYYPLSVGKVAALLHRVGLGNLLIFATGAGEQLATPILGLFGSLALAVWLLFLRAKRAPAPVAKPSAVD
jgi:hypothetical protein